MLSVFDTTDIVTGSHHRIAMDSTIFTMAKVKVHRSFLGNPKTSSPTEVVKMSMTIVAIAIAARQTTEAI